MVIQVSAAQFNALAGNGGLLGNGNVLKSAGLTFSTPVGMKAINGLSPLAAAGMFSCQQWCMSTILGSSFHDPPPPCVAKP